MVVNPPRETGERKARHFVCPICKKVFNDLSNHKRHVDAVCLKIKKYKCTECGDCFGQKIVLERHVIARHRGERPYECHLCDKKCSQLANLKTHIDGIHYKLRRFVCEHCGWGTADGGNYRKHINEVHLKLKPYACETCGRRYPRKESLQRHLLLVHEGARPHECHHCSATFGEKGHMKTHVDIIPLGLRPHKCHLCPKTFAYIQERDQHEKLHDEKYKETCLKKKEEWFVHFCNRYGIIFDREVHITYRRCGEKDTWARLDFVIYRPTYVVIVSVDEFQHRDREIVCEVARMSKVVCSIRQATDDRPILWIRWNPDTFAVNGEKVRVSIEDREEVLIRCIDNSDELLGERNVALYYLFYDCLVDKQGACTAEVTCHPDYSTHWRDIVAGCIFE